MLHNLENTLNQIEEQYKKLSIEEVNINSYIEKLLLVIEKDNFNSAEAYNYCKILKELLKRKRIYGDVSSKYQMVLKISNSSHFRSELSKKEKSISKKQYTARVFSREEAITKYLNQEKEIL